MGINYFPAPNEILNSRMLLTDPRKKGKLIPFTPSYKLAFFAICKLLNPFLHTNETSRVVTYQEINDECNIPIATLKKIMPVLILNFPKYFSVLDRQFAQGYVFKFNYSFIATAQGTVTEDSEEKYFRTLNETQHYKYEYFKKIPLQYENKRTQFFKKFSQSDIHFWERNIKYALTTLAGSPGWNGKVPNAWFWRCLEKDYAWNRLDRVGRDKALKAINGVEELTTILPNLFNFKNKAS